MLIRDLKLADFKMLHLLISLFFPAAISQTISMSFKKLTVIVTFARVHLSNKINHCQAPSCWSFLSYLLFDVSAVAFVSSGTLECSLVWICKFTPMIESYLPSYGIKRRPDQRIEEWTCMKLQIGRLDP